MSGSSARTALAASDERIRNALRREIDRALNIDRLTTRAALAADSGVNIHTIDSITSRDTAKHRRIAAEDALSLAWALGERAVNALLSVIAYGSARSVDDMVEDCPRDSAVTALGAMATFMAAAADGRIDHTEERPATEAVDLIIAELSPFSSAGRGK